jgi:crotonobetainyl-CoA:carnitine CoA-transferase CaiB-like acyl-CoA transferase
MAGVPGGPPVVPGVQIGDLAGGGMFAAIGILAAVAERDRTGRGRFVDVSMLDGVVSWLSIHAGAYLATGQVPGLGLGALTGAYACYRVYEAADGRFLTVGALEPQFWRALCEELGCHDLVEEQYGPPERQMDMAERLASIFRQKPRDQWMEELRSLPVCVGPVNDVAEALSDPQVRHRGMVADVDGRPVGPGAVLKMGTRSGYRPAPGFGQDTAEVLAMVGVDETDLAALRARGIV